MEFAYLNTPLGSLKIEGDQAGLSAITFIEEYVTDTLNIPPCLEDAIYQLKEYFEGKRIHFDLKLNPRGTSFQERVWQELQHIPYGKTCSYLTMAKNLGDAKVIRAAASANGKNPISIIIPCHRVIGSDGSLTGYASGLHRKKWLLTHENPVKQTSLFD